MPKRVARRRKNPKVPKTEYNPVVNKTPRFASDPSFDGKPMSWRFSSADKNGPFAWVNLDEPTAYKETLEKLVSFETMNETDLRNGGCHPIAISDLSREAQRRLEEIYCDDLDSLFSFRITGGCRIFAIFQGNIMRVLWYDPDHNVCPSTKKHT